MGVRHRCSSRTVAVLPCSRCKLLRPRAEFPMQCHGLPAEVCTPCREQQEARRARKAAERQARARLPRYVPSPGDTVAVRCSPPLTGRVLEVDMHREVARVFTEEGLDRFWFAELRKEEPA